MKFYKELFREIRKSKKISVSTLANSIERSYNAVHKWENGERNPSAGDVRLMAMILEISPSEISDLEELVPIHKKSSNTGIDTLSGDLLVEKYLHEINNIIQNYGEIPEINIEAVIGLENKVKQTKRQIEIQKRRASNYKKTLNLAPIIIYAKDIGLRYSYVNDEFINQTGLYSKNDVIGTKASEIFDFKEIKNIMKYEQEVLETLQPVRNREISIPGTKNRKTGLINIFPLIEEDKRIESIVCSIHDITYIKKLLDRFEKLDTLLNEMEDYIYIRTLNPDRFIYRSRGIERITGRKKVEFYEDPKLWYNLVHPDDIKQATIQPEDLKTDYIKKKYRIKNILGGYRWIEDKHYRSVIDSLGIPYYYGIARDISIQVEQEELKELLEIYTNFIDVGIGILDYDLKKYLYINTFFEKIIGYTKKEIINIYAYDFMLQKVIHPEDKDKMKKYQLDEDLKYYTIRIVSKNRKIKLTSVTRKNIKFKGRKCRFIAVKLLENLGKFEGVWPVSAD
ncbi:MAG TPA: PAS domain S-box protein [Victivallales bacterium]|nr:PAS domain S-box protein [Victivallales bacterium]